MEIDFSNMTLNEYLMYERHWDLARNYTPRKSVSPMRNRILVYPDSNEEDEEYCSMPPLLPCFQTPQPYATFNSRLLISRMKLTYEISLEEYARYELAMSTMKSEIQVPTHSFTSQFFNQSQHTPNPPLNEKDSSLEEILDDLFRIGAENLRKAEHEVPHMYDDKTVDITDYKDIDQEDGKLPDLMITPKLYMFSVALFITLFYHWLVNFRILDRMKYLQVHWKTSRA
ncbi:hypothetical protein Tco_1263206 [Tanacetum coccineum]